MAGNTRFFNARSPFVPSTYGNTAASAMLSSSQRIRVAIPERGRSDLLTARFRVRIPAPEPNLSL